MRSLLGRLAVAALLTGAAGAVTYADSIGPTCGGAGDPGNCGGNIYTLTLNSSTPGPLPFTTTYVIGFQDDTSSFNGKANPGYALAVALQLNINGGGTVTNLETALASAPGGIGDWSSVMTGGANSSGCSGMGNFFCVQLLSANQGANAPDKTGSGNVYTWTFNVTLPSGQTLDQSTLGDEIKATFFTATTGNTYDGVQTSTAITLQSPTATPEPVSALLYGTGMFGIALFRRRARRQETLNL